MVEETARRPPEVIVPGKAENPPATRLEGEGCESISRDLLVRVPSDVEWLGSRSATVTATRAEPAVTRLRKARAPR